MRSANLTALLFLLFFACSFSSTAQDSAVITWKTAAEKISEKEYKIKFVGIIRKGWHLYAAPNTEAEISGITITNKDSTLALKNMDLVPK